MTLFNLAWSRTAKETILKCWIQTWCLSNRRIEEARTICESLIQSEDTNSPVLLHEPEFIYNGIHSLPLLANDTNSSNYCPYNDVVDEVRDIENAADLLDVLNGCVVPEEDDTRHSLPKNVTNIV